MLSAGCLAAALLLTAAIYSTCGRIGRRIPQGGIAISYDGVVTELEEPSPEQMHILRMLRWGGADPDGAAVSSKRAGNSRSAFLPLETERAD